MLMPRRLERPPDEPACDVCSRLIFDNAWTVFDDRLQLGLVLDR
jgi:hypothetical protein